MKSSEGTYFAGLDQLRAVAAYIVFVWHFNLINGGERVGPGVLPLSILTEGHTGVALFMTLSGYLFTKIIGDRALLPGRFLFNRAVRLLPLLVVVVVASRIAGDASDLDLPAYIWQLAAGLVTTKGWPNGAWSVIVECHFYALLPVLIFLLRKSATLLCCVVAVAIAVRSVVEIAGGPTQFVAYFSILGRIDQFAIGMLVARIRPRLFASDWFVSFSVACFLLYYQGFDAMGGYFGYPGELGDVSLWPAVWVIHPTIEAVFYSVLILWVDERKFAADSRLPRVLAAIGESSYSLYLLHFFIVLKMATYWDQHCFALTSPLLRVFAGTICFLLFAPLAYLSYRLVERPFLAFRVRYTQ